MIYNYKTESYYFQEGKKYRQKEIMQNIQDSPKKKDVSDSTHKGKP